MENHWDKLSIDEKLESLKTNIEKLHDKYDQLKKIIGDLLPAVELLTKKIFELEHGQFS